MQVTSASLPTQLHLAHKRRQILSFLAFVSGTLAQSFCGGNATSNEASQAPGLEIPDGLSPHCR